MISSSNNNSSLQTTNGLPLVTQAKRGVVRDILLVKYDAGGVIEDIVLVENKLSMATRPTTRQLQGMGQHWKLKLEPKVKC